MADCGQVREWVLLRADEPAEQEAVAAHLRECAACASFAERQAQIDTVLRTSLVAEPPAELRHQLVALVRAEAQRLHSGLEQSLEAAPATTAAGEQAGAVLRPLPGSPRARSSQAPDREPGIRRPPRPAERVAAYGLAALIAIWLVNTVLEQGPLLLGLAQDAITTLRVLLTSTVWLVLPDSIDVLSWLGPALAVLVLAWFLRGQPTGRAADRL